MSAAISASNLAYASAAASIGSAVVGGIGAISQGQAASASANYNAQVAQNNAKIAQQNATWAAQQGETQAATQEAKTRATVGAEKAAQAASGIDVNSGSAVDVRSSAAALGELNALTVRSNAARQAYGYQTQAASDTGQAALDKSQASSASEAGFLNAGTTVLGGLGSAASNYGKYLDTSSPASSLTSSFNAPETARNILANG